MKWYDQDFAFGITHAQLWYYLAPIVAGLVAAGLTHFLTSRRENAKVRKEWLAQRLEGAYLLLLDAMEVPGMPLDQSLAHKRKLEMAVNTIDLYGTKEAKAAAVEIAKAFAAGDAWVNYGKLQTALRDSLRKNLGLERLVDPVFNLRIFHTPEPTTSEPSRKP